MQDAQPDPKECRRVGAGQQIINFRPSPNTGVIKKFRKANSDGSDQAAPGDIDMKHSISPEYEVTVKEEKPSFHPPLPPDSPPRSRSASPSMNMGMEMAGLDDTQRLVEHARSMISEEAKAAHAETADKKKGCRDFIRGTCNRVGCKFVHDPTQREGVYKFCHKFQNSNSKCTYQHCRFVHATVFEEQAFYRTGKLPPHTTAHQKKPEAKNSADMKNAIKLLLTPPPPPPGNAATNITNAYTKTIESTSLACSSQPPTPKPSMSIPLVKVIPEASAAASIGNSLAKPWTEHEIKGVSVATDQNTEKNDSSKCDGCVVNENRLQHYMTKAKSMTESLLDVTQKMEALDLKEKRLNAVVVYLTKTMDENPTNGVVNRQVANLLNSLGPDAYLLGRKG